MRNEPLDDRRSRRRRAQSTLAHCLAQFLIVHPLAGRFHGRQQCGFRVTRGRLGLFGFGFQINHRCFLTRLGWHQLILRGGYAGLAPVHLKVAGHDEDFAGSQERILIHSRDASGIFEFRWREKDGHESSQDEVEDFLFLLLQARAGQFAGGDDGEVIADFCVVKNSLVRLQPILRQHLGGAVNGFLRKRGAGIGFGERLQMLANCADVILRQTFGIGPRVGQQLVPFIQRLRDAQRVARAEPKLAACLALQRGEVEELRRNLFAWLFVFLHHARLPGATLDNCSRLRLGPEPLRAGLVVVIGFLETFTEPSP